MFWYANEGGYNGILYHAVRDYVSQDCANNNNCCEEEVAQTYGWPMNSWCVEETLPICQICSPLWVRSMKISLSLGGIPQVWRIWCKACLMFDLSTSFNGDLSSWNTKSVTSMKRMFKMVLHPSMVIYLQWWFIFAGHQWPGCLECSGCYILQPSTRIFPYYGTYYKIFAYSGCT